MAQTVKNSPVIQGDTGKHRFDPWLGSSPRRRNGNPLQYSSLGNPMDRGAWRATIHRVVRSWTQLSTHALYLSLGFLYSLAI